MVLLALRNLSSQAGEMTQWVNVLVARAGNLSLSFQSTHERHRVQASVISVSYEGDGIWAQERPWKQPN